MLKTSAANKQPDHHVFPKQTDQDGEPTDVAGQPQWKVIIYLLLNRPHRYHLARLLRLFYVGLIGISVLFFVLSTEASLYDEAPWLYDGVETFTVLIFTLEYFLRVSTLSISPKWNWGGGE